MALFKLLSWRLAFVIMCNYERKISNAEFLSRNIIRRCPGNGNVIAKRAPRWCVYFCTKSLGRLCEKEETHSSAKKRVN